ncbi:MAG: DUF547 domain-containing protein [Acidimicrobiia bacterium]
MTDQPNPLAVAWSIARARRTRRPRPTGQGFVQSNDLAEVLSLLRTDGIAVLPSERGALARFRFRMEEVDPDALSVDGALSFWLNLYNAGALALAADALTEREATVLRLPGAFDTPWAMVGGEALSLNDIEHGKIRRFKDPRIHAALVCGSVSCPSLRHEPFGNRLDVQLNDQMQTFLSSGGARVDRDSATLHLSRIFLWYGGDFVRPKRMPTWVPARRRDLARSIAQWMPDEDANWVVASSPSVEFSSYDWGLACSIA